MKKKKGLKCKLLKRVRKEIYATKIKQYGETFYQITAANSQNMLIMADLDKVKEILSKLRISYAKSLTEGNRKEKKSSETILKI